ENKKRLQNVSCSFSHAARERFSGARIAAIVLKQCYTDHPSFSHPERYENLHPIPTAGSHCNHASVQVIRLLILKSQDEGHFVPNIFQCIE
uniref:Uncharacterized protein n=1 Tax=Sinocyclocheilus grahami TaxID=75366 RepID=A0A672RTI4_SINGR